MGETLLYLLLPCFLKIFLSPTFWEIQFWGTGEYHWIRVPRNISIISFFFPSWGRWRDILSHGRFKRRMTERDVETICRAILVYCLLHYRGDENIKGFIWDLISPAENGKTKELQNHSGNYQLFTFHLFIGYLILSRSKGFSQSKSSMSPLLQVYQSLCLVDARGKK